MLRSAIFLSFFIISSEIFSQQKISIIGVGDIMLGSTYPDDNLLPPNDGKDLFNQVESILKNADITFGNVEGVFYDGNDAPRDCKDTLVCYRFKMPERYIGHLKNAGFNTLSIANNHSYDFGEKARKRMELLLKKAGFSFAGSLKQPYHLFSKKGVRYGLFCFSSNKGTPSIHELNAMSNTIRKVKQQCDIVIVSFHGGAEGVAFSRVPKSQEIHFNERRGNVHKFAHAAIDAGADIVFGHGPHVIRALELYKNRLIVYSLGNFCTAGRISIQGKSGYAPIVRVNVNRKGEFLNGQIYSAIQLDKKGPVLDSHMKAAKEYIQLTKLDFPDTPLRISTDGKISRLVPLLSK